MSKMPIYVYIPINKTETKNTKNLLSDLGKATRRGIKKCYKCGEYNGTRGIICKNKLCDAVFKDCSEKRKTNLDAVKLVTGPSRLVYSVRVRDRGPDCRGFVQLPLMHNAVESEVALCFVDSCQRLFDVSILKCHESEQNDASSICVHIESAVKSCNIATPVDFKLEILKSLNIPHESKQKLWLFATENEGPIVQRVSKMVMAIKCQVTPKHPLGYLHFALSPSKGREVYDKYYCSCSEFLRNDDFNTTERKCIHYYACICALAGDAQLIDEFFPFISLELNLALTVDDSLLALLQKNKEITKETEKNKHMKSNMEQSTKHLIKHKPYIKTVIKNKNYVNKYIKSSWEFSDWLSSITENINNKLHNSDNAKIDILLYTIPENFYFLLKQLLQNSGIKTNSANSSKCVWYITEFTCLKKIFNTNLITLQMPKIINRDNLVSKKRFGKVFMQYEPKKTSNQIPLVTIEWIPNILNVTKIGQLKLIINCAAIIDNCVECI